MSAEDSVVIAEESQERYHESHERHGCRRQSIVFSLERAS